MLLGKQESIATIKRPVSGLKLKTNVNAFLGQPQLSLKTLDKDTVSFQGLSKGVVEDMKYKNALDERLVSSPNADFEKQLKAVKGINNFKASKVRVESLSRYLKEEMVGFIVPEYTTKNEKKGGYEWFERSMEYLLKGCKNGAKVNDYKPLAKELLGLLATHDNYWKSNEFKAYLGRLEPSDAIKATMAAIDELQSAKAISFTGEKVKMWGYFSPIKAMKELLDAGGAYSGKALKFDEPFTKHPRIPEDVNASLEHIMPKSWGGPCDDANYLLTSQKANTKRGNMSLLAYLKGNNDNT